MKGRGEERSSGPGVPEPILIYTDGACSGNPGPAGIGGVLVCGKRRKEISRFIGNGTSNRAELIAVKEVLSLVNDRKREVILHIDSEYTLKSIMGEYRKIKKNLDLLAEIRGLIRSFGHLRLVKVEAHRGVPENERADFLAREAIRRSGRGPCKG